LQVVVEEAKRNDDALADSESRTRLIVDMALDAVVAMDSRGVVMGWNAQAEKTFGWTADEAMGKLLSEIVIPERYRSAHAQGLKKYLATGEGPVLGKRIEITALRKNREEFPVELAISPIRSSKNVRFSAFIRDITERKEHETELMKANAELARASRLKDEFLASMSHELRTPLNGVLGLSEALQEQVYGPITDSQMPSINQNEESGKHHLELIKDILDITKI
jgi:PAS domain S-box-containing protein